MYKDINYLIERKDKSGKWHLIETSENIYYKLYKLLPQTKENLHNYLHHCANTIRFINYENVLGFEEQIKLTKIQEYDFNPLSKYYINTIVTKIYKLECHSFENIYHKLDEDDKEKFLKAFDWFSNISTLENLDYEHLKRESLKSLISNHEYIEFFEDGFDAPHLNQFRMIFYYQD